MSKHSFFYELIRLNQVVDNPFQLIGTAVGLLILFSSSLVLKNPLIASFGILGFFTFYYYKPWSIKLLTRHMLVVGAAFLIGLIVGLVCAHFTWTIPLGISLIAFCCRFLFRLYQLEKPGAFFIIMVTAMCSSIRIPFSQLPLGCLYTLLGIGLALIVALFVSLTEKELLEPVNPPFIQRLKRDPEFLIGSIFYANTLFFASYLGIGLGLVKPYWVVTSCASILQGDNLHLVMTRHIQRIFGTVIGLGVAALLLELILSQFEIAVVITILFLLLEFFAKRNYALAQFFSPSMSLLLIKFSHPDSQVYSLLLVRFIGVFIGSFVGLLAAVLFTLGFVFYDEKFELLARIKQLLSTRNDH